MPRPLRYLECLDSVRTTPASDNDLELREASDYHVFLEVLTTLALGHDIVVPQPFAFDSLPFLTIAAQVLRQNDARHPDTPFRLHLHGAPSYEDAIAGMLRRVHDPDHPFVSSLLPELTDLSPEEVDKLAAHPDRLASLLNPHWPDMKLVIDEFSGAELVRPRARVTPSLSNLVSKVAESGATTSRAGSSLPPDIRETFGRIARSLVALGALEEPQRFGERSVLRRPGPWNSSGEATAADLVGGGEELTLVIEFVDTLYNVVIVNSIGVATASYSTNVVLEADLASARAAAQHIALLTATDPHDTPVTPPHEEGFEFRLPTIDSGAGTRQPLADLKADAFGPLLAARGDAGSPFWKSARALGRAIAANHARGLSGPERGAQRLASNTQKALETHLVHVAGLLPRGASMIPQPNGLAMFSLAGTGAVAGTMINVSMLFDAIAGGTLWALPYSFHLVHALGRRRETNRRASAFTELVGIQ